MKLKKFDEMNEKYTEDNYFMTDIDTSDVTISDYGDIEYEDADIKECNVYWDYELISKNYGIDSIIPTIKKVNLKINFITWEDDDEVPNEMEYEFDIMNSNIDTDNMNDGGNIISMPFYPSEVEIDTLDPEKNPNIKILF